MPARWARSRNKRQVENERRGQDRVAAEKIDLDLHLVAEPAEDIDVVPAFFVVAARRIVVDADDVRKVFVEVGINLGLKNVLEHRQL